MFTSLAHLHSRLGGFLNHLQAPVLLATRLWVSWVFLKSGWLKLTTWDSTLTLFEYEYQVPWLSPGAAAVAATAGELFFPVLLVLGWFSRVGALGLSAVNAMAVYAYWHVLGAEGAEAGLGQHQLWGYMLAVLVVTGAGSWSLDEWIRRRTAGGKPR